MVTTTLPPEAGNAIPSFIDEFIEDGVIAENQREKAAKILEDAGVHERQAARILIKSAIAKGELQRSITVEVGDEKITFVLDEADSTLADLRTKLQRNDKIRSVDIFTVNGAEVLKSQEEQHLIAGDLGIKKAVQGPPPSSTAPDVDPIKLKELFPDDDPAEWVEKLKELTTLRDNLLPGRATNVLIQSAVKASKEDVEERAPDQLSTAAWSDLVQINSLTCGLQMNRVMPQRAFRAAFRTRWPIPCFRPYTRADISASVTSDEWFYQRTQAKIHKSEASFSYGFVSASEETTHRTATQDTKQGSRVFITGQWNLPRVKLFFDEQEVEPEKHFIDAIDDALAIVGDSDTDTGSQSNAIDSTAAPGEVTSPPDTSVDRNLTWRCYESLLRVFGKYGHIWPMEVTLGGQLEISDTRESASESTHEDNEFAVRTAIAAKLSKSTTNVGHAYRTTNRKTEKLTESLQELSFAATGGEPLLANRNDLAEWIASVAPYRNWRVISLEQSIPLYEFIGRFPELEKQSAKIAGVLRAIENQREALNYGDCCYLKSAFKPLNWLALYSKETQPKFAATFDRGSEGHLPFVWRLVSKPDNEGTGPITYGQTVFLTAESGLWLRGQLKTERGKYWYVGTGDMKNDSRDFYAWTIVSGAEKKEGDNVEFGDQIKLKLKSDLFLVGGNRNAGSYTPNQIENNEVSDAWTVQSLSTPPR